MLGVVASWATIIGFPLAVVTILATVASVGRQRGLRQQLREILDPVVKACDEHQYGNDDYLTEGFLRTTAEKLRILSERDGLKSGHDTARFGEVYDVNYQCDQLQPGSCAGSSSARVVSVISRSGWRPLTCLSPCSFRRPAHRPAHARPCRGGSNEHILHCHHARDLGRAEQLIRRRYGGSRDRPGPHRSGASPAAAVRPASRSARRRCARGKSVLG
jgi:hypothetical protein